VVGCRTSHKKTRLISKIKNDEQFNTARRFFCFWCAMVQQFPVLIVNPLMRHSPIILACIALALILLSPSVAMASETCFAAQSYWIGFRDYWFGFFKSQNNMVFAILGIGALCIFIITRGKWKK
jgi:hypothetical protein